jgi:hypothetical protein
MAASGIARELARKDAPKSEVTNFDDVLLMDKLLVGFDLHNSDSATQDLLQPGTHL